MEQKRPVQELAKISDLFISSSEKERRPSAYPCQCGGGRPNQAGDAPAVEETVSVQRRIAYPDTEKAQEEIRSCLFRHLEEDYMICRVELRKVTEVLEPGNKKRREEEILIVLKDPPFGEGKRET